MENTKKRIQNVMAFSRLLFHWTYIPFLIYLGFRQGADEGQPALQLLQLLWI